MAGDQVRMSPTSLLMIHDPSTIAMGNARDMEKAINTLNEVKESIINAYMAKTGLRHSKVAELMENETWMNAKKAFDLGFCDEVLFGEKDEGDEEMQDGPDDTGPALEAHLYSTRQMGLSILNRIKEKLPEPEPQGAEERPPETGPAEIRFHIGLDGRTENGAMPYMILSRQLDLLR